VLAARRLVLASRIAGIAAPVGSPPPSVAEPAEAADGARAAAALGFAAMLCIHPAQVDAADEAFRPTPKELAWAREVLDAVGVGAGAVQMRGRMVDAPVIASARAILDRAG
jgi:citrate lyase subunit beta / citryl-CoA lyase